MVPPKGAPNVLLILTDDVGFGAPSTFGGLIPTPALDRVAKNGLRYINFHTTALCSPTRAALRAERVLRLQEALNTLEPIDREVLSLRHFEELTAAETARVLGIEESAAAKRYFRALKRLKEVLAAMLGGQEGF